MEWLTLALLAPLFWTVSNFIDKYSLDTYVSNTYDFLFFSSLTSWIFVPILILIFGVPVYSPYVLVPILLGILLVYSYGFYIKALEANDTSRLVIFFKLIPVVTLLLGFLFLGQAITTVQFLAFLVILAGATLISIERSGLKFKMTAGLGYILVAILMWSIMFLVGDWVLTKMSFGTFIILDTFGSALAGLMLLLIPSFRKKIMVGLRATSTKKMGWFTVNNTFDTLGQMSIKKSLDLAPSAGLVSVVAQVQSFYAIAFGLLLTFFLPSIFKEDISRKTITIKFLGAAVMFAGVYMLF